MPMPMLVRSRLVAIPFGPFFFAQRGRGLTIPPMPMPMPVRSGLVVIPSCPFFFFAGRGWRACPCPCALSWVGGHPLLFIYFSGKRGGGRAYHPVCLCPCQCPCALGWWPPPSCPLFFFLLKARGGGLTIPLCPCPCSPQSSCARFFFLLKVFSRVRLFFLCLCLFGCVCASKLASVSASGVLIARFFFFFCSKCFLRSGFFFVFVSVLVASVVGMGISVSSYRQVHVPGVFLPVSAHITYPRPEF